MKISQITLTYLRTIYRIFMHMVKVNRRKYIRIHHTAAFYVSENHGDILLSHLISRELEIINSYPVWLHWSNCERIIFFLENWITRRHDHTEMKIFHHNKIPTLKNWKDCVVKKLRKINSEFVLSSKSSVKCERCIVPTVDNIITEVARFTGPTWGPPGSCRTQMGPMLVPWTLLSGHTIVWFSLVYQVRF